MAATLLFGIYSSPIVGGGDATHIFERPDEIGVSVEAALVGDIGQADALPAVDEVHGFLDSCPLYICCRCHTRHGDHLAIELAGAHAHL